MYLLFLNILLFLYFSSCFARIHKMEITQDDRKYFGISKFGFYQRGTLEVTLLNFHATPENENALFGFTLDRIINGGMSQYLDTYQDTCILENIIPTNNREDEVIYFLLNLKNNKLQVKCGANHPLTTIQIYKGRVGKKTSLTAKSFEDFEFDITHFTEKDKTFYNASFMISVETLQDEGLYNLFFHSCPSYNPQTETVLDFQIEIIEGNMGSYLSAGEIPLPTIYCLISILFFLSGMYWVYFLRQSKHLGFQIYYLMAVLMFLKATALVFHGVHYYYIGKLGLPLSTWAVLFYIARLLEEVLLFVVLIVIGTGWTFVRHVLAPGDKILLIMVIPLQILANVAHIILEESDEGSRDYLTWKYVFILADLLCCICVVLPAFWSIRRLRKVSKTDGQIDVRKLSLFRHFYVMLVCYIYFTRIIGYLLTTTLPFQYDWLCKLGREMATYIFFILTAYKFRPLL